jgi:hypothetical protein
MFLKKVIMKHKDVVSDGDLVRDYINGKELAIELLIKRHQQLRIRSATVPFTHFATEQTWSK